MKYCSLFSGIGGFELGIQRALPEAECVGYSEVDKYAEAIYRRHFAEHRGYGDATRIVPDEIPDFALLVAGFPCQAFSVAGKRKGFQDTRGTLFFEILRILRHKRPRYFLLENVKGLLSHGHGETFQTILGVLSDAGYLLQWEVLNSRNYGVPQNRPRVFVVGHLRGEPRPEVFPIGEGNRESEIEGTQDGEVVNCLDSNYYKGPDGKRSLIYVGAVVSPESTKRIDDGKQLGRNYREGQRVYDSKGIANALSVNKGYYGQATGLYLVDKTGKELDEVPPLTGGGHSGGNHSQMALIATGVNRPSRGGEPRKDSLSCTVKAGESGSKNLVLVDKNIDGKIYAYEEYTPPLRSGPTNYNMAILGQSIRRLTPIECERLQAFPDNWTEYGVMDGEEVRISDTQRYKCLGNAVTVSVVSEIVAKLYRQ